jgi:hypothetical protein
VHVHGDGLAGHGKCAPNGHGLDRDTQPAGGGVSGAEMLSARLSLARDPEMLKRGSGGGADGACIRKNRAESRINGWATARGLE